MKKFIALLAAFLLACMMLGSNPANATGNVGPNQPEYWEKKGYGDCYKPNYSNNTGKYTVPAAPAGKKWSLLVIKAGSDSGGGQIEGSYAIENPVPGKTYSHPTKNSISHIILCTKDATPPVDACPNTPGHQTPGTDCNPPPVDACPNLPGHQTPGTNCNPPVDVCPNLPGHQPHGTNCNPPVDPPKNPPTTPQPPVCDDECKIPFVATKAKRVTKCVGVLSGRVLNNVRVPRGESCTLVDSHVNGSVVSTGARSVTLADTTVRKNINVRGVTGDVTFGSKGHACRFDPYVGGSIFVKNSHNVLICEASVCKDIVVSGNDGRITVRDSSARRVVVRNNKRFDSDGNVNHFAASVIRVIDVKGKKVIKNNHPRRVEVRR